MKAETVALAVLPAIVGCWVGTVMANEPEVFYGDSYYASVVMMDEPNAYWRFNDEADLPIAADLTGDYDGEYKNGVTLTAGVPLAGFGTGNTAANFDGISQWVAGTTLGNLGSNLAAGFTFEAWIKGASQSNKYLFGGSTASGQRLWLAMNQTIGASQNQPGKFTLYVRDEVAMQRKFAYQATDSGFNDGQWHHFVVVADPYNYQMQFYLDGLPKTPIAVDGTFAFIYFTDFEVPFGIGAKSDVAGAGNFWQGMVDEVAIYNKILSAAQVKAHYDAAFVDATHCRYALAGDVNKDCIVDIKDFGAIAERWMNCIDIVLPGCQ